LNGTAHTFHHDFAVLTRQIRDGGEKLGGNMPSFSGKLSEAQIASVIAYIQSLWPQDIYATWAKSYPDDAAAGIRVASNGGETADASESPVTRRLAELLPPNAEIGEPEETPVAGIFGVRTGSRYVYLDESGRYAFIGKLMDLEKGEDLSEQKLGTMRLEKLSTFADADKVVFPAKGEEKAHLDVFTDTTCPYCRRLHGEVPELQAAGITVRYLPFPRGGLRGKGYDEMRSVWCAEDRRAEMNAAKSGAPYDVGATDCESAKAVGTGYRLGVEVGVTGTPSIILPDGRMIPGYRPWRDLAAALGVSTE
jgi:thiol:disulfide interchange protein DsbC